MCNTREPREQKDTIRYCMNTTQTMNATHTRRAASVVYASYGFTRVEPWFLT